jgi:hypothetical protein
MTPLKVETQLLLDAKAEIEWQRQNRSCLLTAVERLENELVEARKGGGRP